MSATFNLYKVVDGVEYLGDTTDKVKWSMKNQSLLDEYEKKLGRPSNDASESDIKDWEDKMEKEKWSDGIKHEMFDLAYYNAIAKKRNTRFKHGRTLRSWRRMSRRLDKFEYKTFTNLNGWTYKYLAVNTVEYAQGWFLKERFFKKEHTVYFAVTKTQLEGFIQKYIDFESTDNRGLEMARRFLNSWEDGMIFEAAF